MTTLTSSLNTVHTHTQASLQGIVYVSGADWDKVQRWDGVANAALDAGIAGAPTNWDGNTSATGAGNVEAGEHLIRYRFIDEKTGYVSEASNATSKTSTGSSYTFNIVAAAGGPSGIERSSDAKVSHIVLEATTSGGSLFYEVGRALNAGVSTIVYNVSDATLSESTYDWDDDGHLQPPYAQIIHAHRGIMFYAHGGVVHSTGTVSVTNGSATVTGSGTGWTEGVVDRRFKVAGDVESYKIASRASATSMTLETVYGGSTASGANYKVYRSDPNVIWHSKPLFPESVETLAFTKVLQNTTDRVRGMASFGGELVILGDSTMERWSYTAIPSQDGQINPIPGRRGLCWHRCSVNVEGVLYGMDREGIWAYSGNAPVPISIKIDDIFAGSDIEWDHVEKFHASWLPRTREIRWWYVKTGDTVPKYYLAYEPDAQRWSTGSYSQGITSSASIITEGKTRLVLGDENGFPWFGDSGIADGVDASTQATTWLVNSGTTTSRIVVQSSGLYTTDQGLDGAPVYWVQGNQTRIVTSNSSTQLNMLSVFGSTPSVGDTVHIGRISAKLKTKAISLNDLAENQELRYLHVWFEPTSSAQYLYIRVYINYSASAKNDWVAKSDGTPGVTMPAASATDIKVDLSNADGYARVPLDLDMHRVIEVEFEIIEPGVDLEMIGFAIDGMADELENML